MPLMSSKKRATIRMSEYNFQAFLQRKKIIKCRSFNKGDLVLRRTFKEGKLKPKWEDPFIVADDESKGVYIVGLHYHEMFVSFF